MIISVPLIVLLFLKAPRIVLNVSTSRNAHCGVTFFKNDSVHKIGPVLCNSFKSLPVILRVLYRNKYFSDFGAYVR